MSSTPGGSLVPPLDPQLRDFRNALFVIFDELGLPEPTPLQYDFADFLQSGGDRKLVMAYRGFGKSLILDAWCVHEHRLAVEDYGRSNLLTLMTQAAGELADLASTFCKRLIEEIPFYQCLKPGTGDLSAGPRFDVGPKFPSKDPSFKSVGIFGGSVGSRATRIVFDDLETPNTAGTVGMREKLWARFEGLQDLLPAEGGRMVGAGTPHFEDSMYSRIQDDLDGFETRIYPARYPTLKRAEEMGDSLAPPIREALAADPSLVGKPTDPRRFDEERLREREANAGRSHFARQYELDTSLSDRENHPLRLADLIVHNLDPELAPERLVWGSNPIEDFPVWGLRGDRLNRSVPYQAIDGKAPRMMPYTGCVMFVDPSGRGRDETSFAVSKILNAQVFVPDFGGYLDGFAETTLLALAKTAKQWGVNEIIVESNYGGGMFEELLKPHLKQVGHLCAITPTHSTGQKERRICDTLEPLLNQHRIVIDENALWRDAQPREGISEERAMFHRLAYQLSRITREPGSLRHDDRLEAVAGACAHWVEHLGRSVEEAAASNQVDALAEAFSDIVTPDNRGGNWHNSILPPSLRP